MLDVCLEVILDDKEMIEAAKKFHLYDSFIANT